MEFIQTSRLQQNRAPQTSRQFTYTIRLHVSSSSKDKKSYVWFIQTFFSILLNKQQSRVVFILYRIEFTYTIRLHVSSSSKDKKSYIWFIQIFYSILLKDSRVVQQSKVVQKRTTKNRRTQCLLFSFSIQLILFYSIEQRVEYSSSPVFSGSILYYSTLLYYSTVYSIEQKIQMNQLYDFLSLDELET